MIEDIPCKDCGSYYSHKQNCSYWRKTGLHNQILLLEIKQRVDSENYLLESKVGKLEAENKKMREFINDMEICSNCATSSDCDCNSNNFINRKQCLKELKEGE